MNQEISKFFAGDLDKQNGYNAYIPSEINKNFSGFDNKTLLLLEMASAALSKLNTTVAGVTFTDLFTNMLLHLEAIRSSEIEGTKTDIKEVLSTGKNNSRNEEIQKIVNLMRTTFSYYRKKEKNEDIATIQTLEKINRSLFKNVPSKDKETGRVRTCQNFIGGNSILSALFVPPPPEKLHPLLDDLNDFWNNATFFIPTLIKIAIYHYQFETIHPFVDGNGRTGRILINLQLEKKGLLDFPVLCLSDYWQRNKGYYYNALTTVRFSHDIEYWIRFFLESILNTCNERIKLINEIQELQLKYENLIEANFKNTDNYKKLLEHLLSDIPFITVKEAQEKLNLSYQRTNKIIENLVNIGLLNEESSNKRNRVFVLKEYYDLIFKDITINRPTY